MKHPGIRRCAVMLLMLWLWPASLVAAMEHEFEASAVYEMAVDETKTQAEDNVRKLALRHAAEHAAAYIIERSETDLGVTTQDEIYALAGQVLKLKQEDYDWQVDSQSGVLEVTAKIVAVLDEETVDAKLLEMVHEHQLSKAKASATGAGEANKESPAADDEEIALLKEMDSHHHFTAKQWYRQAESMFHMEAYAAAIYACERTIALEPNHSSARNLWVQAHKMLGKATASAGYDSREK